jgi:hypothetical protein
MQNMKYVQICYLYKDYYETSILKNSLLSDFVEQTRKEMGISIDLQIDVFVIGKEEKLATNFRFTRNYNVQISVR